MKIVGAIYELETGRVRSLGAGRERVMGVQLECNAMRCTASGLAEGGGGGCRPPIGTPRS